MAQKKSRIHVVQPPKDDFVIGTISPLEIFLRTRRQGGRASQVFKTGKTYNRLREKRESRKETGS